MKTCLFDPIFINPQAYFVFPQLYNIQPDIDSLIERAIYTGIIRVVNVNDQLISDEYQNTNEIDLSIFAGSTIEIYQYTDEGSVVLGRWNIPDGEAPLVDNISNDRRYQESLGINDENKVAVEFRNIER